MIDIGFIGFNLSLKLIQNQQMKIIQLSQQAYIDKILEKFYLSRTKMANCLLKKSTLLTLYKKRKKKASPLEKKYKKMSSSLMFLMVEVILDIAYALFLLNYFIKNLSY